LPKSACEKIQIRLHCGDEPNEEIDYFMQWGRTKMDAEMKGKRKGVQLGRESGLEIY
jgi:hypothetical protein